MTKRTFAVSAYGLRDSVFDGGDARRPSSSDAFYPSVVILPGKGHRHPDYSVSAKFSPSGLGIGSAHGPEIASFKNIDRQLICALWNRMSAFLARDSHAACSSAARFSYYCSDLLAEYIKSLINHSISSGAVSKNDPSRLKSSDELVIPIPNEINEYGQEYLLRSFASKQMNVTFVWRPVAAAIRWLDRLGREQGIGEGDWLEVVYAGPDFVECTDFRLRKEQASGREWILPVRHRPSQQDHEDLSGLQLVSLFALQSAGDLLSEKSAQWEAVNVCADLWQCCCGAVPDGIARPFNDGAGWKLWKPQSAADLSRIKIATVEFLRESGVSQNLQKGASLLDVLCGHHKAMEEKHDNESPCAIVLCGPMASKKLAGALARTLGVQFSSSFKRGCILYSDEDDISQGAFLYSQRLKAGLPTYYDVLPSLQIAYEDRNDQEYKWEDLVNEKEIAGGQTYHLPVPIERFLLGAGQNSLFVYLRKESELSDDSGLRRGFVKFAAKPKDDVHLRINVSMKAAAGLAKVVLTSIDSDFLPAGGQYFDYSKMEPCEESDLPEITLSFPKEVVEEPTVRNEEALMQMQNVIDAHKKNRGDIKLVIEAVKSLGSVKNTDTFKYQKIINSLGNADDPETMEMLPKFGEAASWIIMDCLEKYRSHDFLKVPEVNQVVSDAANKMFASAPISVRNLLFDKVKTGLQNKNFKDAIKFFQRACKCAKTDIEIKRLFDFYLSVPYEDSKKNYYTRGIVQLLAYRSNSKTIMTQDLAERMVFASLDTFKEMADTGNIKNKFMDATRLLMMSLKFRFHDQNFLSVKEINGKLVGDGAECLSITEDYIKRSLDILNGQSFKEDRRKLNKIKKIRNYIKEIRKFFEARGDQKFINTIVAFDNEEI